MTPAIRALRAGSIPFESHLYDYVEKGGTSSSARALGFDEHLIVKTLIFEDEKKRALVVLMHGDREVSTKNLARHLKAKTISPCTPETAERHSGYQVGGTSPLGTRTKMPVFIQRTILDLPRILLNGGKRGYLIQIDPRDVARLLDAESIDAMA